MSSNESVTRRQQTRACLDQQAVIDKGQVEGRLDTPIIAAPEALPSGDAVDVFGCCKQQLAMMFFMYKEMRYLRRDLELLSSDVVETAIRKLTLPTIDLVSFLVPSGVVNLAAAASSGAFVTIASVLINEGYDGILENVGMAAFPSTAQDNLTWSVRISGDASAKFGVLPFSENSLVNPLPFKMFCPAGRTIQLQVRNNSAVNIDVAGLLTGFMRPVRGIGGA